MSRVICFCMGGTAGMGLSQNFNHKGLWGNKTNIPFMVSRPTSMKEAPEICKMIETIKDQDKDDNNIED